MLKPEIIKIKLHNSWVDAEVVDKNDEEVTLLLPVWYPSREIKLDRATYEMRKDYTLFAN